MIRALEDKIPNTAGASFIADNAAVIGDVVLGEGSSVWYGAAVRGDVAPIRIGAGTNVQDNATVHVDFDTPCTVGDHVVIGHNAVVHGCTVGDGSLIGMGAILLNHSVIGKNCIVAAGALVPERAVIPDRSLVMGIPARIVRTVTDEEIEHTARNAAAYARDAKIYAREQAEARES